MNIYKLGAVLSCLCVAADARIVAEDFVERLLLGEQTACFGADSDSCQGSPKPQCTPFRSVDYCDVDKSFQTYIQRRTAFVKSNLSPGDDSIWFHHLDDKLAGYNVAASLGLNPPKIYFCTDDVETVASFVPPDGATGFVVRATDLHNNHGVYVLPSGFGSKELIRGVVMSAKDVAMHLSALSAENVIIEEYVGDAEGLPLEIKFHMFDGKVGSINVVANRATECACWAEMDVNQDRLDQFGCFTHSGNGEQSGQCAKIDFQKGSELAYPMKGMDLCSDLEIIDECLMNDMIAVAKKASEAVGVYIRVDFFLGADKKVYVQEFSTNHMNGLRHCSAIKHENGCIDPCFQGEMWKDAAGNSTYGGTPTNIPPPLKEWLALESNAKKCAAVVGAKVESPLATTCSGSPGLGRGSSSTPVATPSPVAPTNAVTSAPVLSPVDPPATVMCPPEGSPLDIQDGGKISIGISNKTNLCTLVEITSKGYLKPVGRSYDGNEWEASSGEYSATEFDCDSTSCKVDLPAPKSGARYQLTSMPSTTYTAADETARFLEQATFGVTSSDIEVLTKSPDRRSLEQGSLQQAFARWIKEQQTVVPLTSHREYYRHRVNARFEVAMETGAVTHPCQQNTRYRRFAFSAKDAEKVLTITTKGAQKMLLLDGFVRTVVNSPVVSLNGEVAFEDGSYLICGSPPEHFIGGEISLETSDRKCLDVSFNGQGGNPSVAFEGATPNVLISLNDDEISPIDVQYVRGDGPSVQEVIVTKSLSDSKCASIGETGNPIDPVYAMYKGELWIHDPRFELIENTFDTPLPDGGGNLAKAHHNFGNPEFSVSCANVPQTFLNEHTCFLSSDSDACAAGSGQAHESGDEFLIALNSTTIRTIYEESGAGVVGTLYLYAADGLRIADDTTVQPPCQANTKSRWVPATCSPLTVEIETASLLGNLISEARASDDNTNMVDVILKKGACNDVDHLKVGFVVEDLSGECWRNVHPDLLNVYDFTPWTRSHPGNSQFRNPIKEFAESGSSTLVFPGWHEMDRWQKNKSKFRKLGRLGDTFNYYTVPEAFRTEVFNAAVGFDPETATVTHEDATTDTSGTLICASPYEKANDPTVGGSVGRRAFDSMTGEFQTTRKAILERQKETVWTHISLEAPDQLRQKVAWALAQILVVVTGDVSGAPFRTELFTVYYDIFVRNAFGNYRDILKEVAYSHVMAQMLTFFGSRSTAYEYEKDESVVQFADENFAREIMQLFTTGLFKLKENGNEIKDEHGVPLQVYSNDDIVEYARAWTGFTGQQKRGNIEMDGWNRVDPMKIDESTRDNFPKMGLDRTYIGDGYPLCSDLSNRHFLSEGATYKLLGRSSIPKLQSDPSSWADDKMAINLSLDKTSSEGSLFATLCGSTDATKCSFAPVVVVAKKIECSGIECSVDTLRTVEVADGIFYEYVPPSCVFQAFYSNGKLVARQNEKTKVMCADPRVQTASSACCFGNSWSKRFWNSTYWGERVSFATAEERCGIGNLCTRARRPSCSATTVGKFCWGRDRVWTADECSVRVKIDANGNAAIVHAPAGVEDAIVEHRVREAAKTFFRVEWSNSSAVNDVILNCASISGCNVTADDMCLCDVTVSDQIVFSEADSLSRDDILDSLHIGAFNPSLSDSEYSSTSINQFTLFTKAGTLSPDSVFEVTDGNGVTHRRKNMKSTVTLTGLNLSFRNPVHFMNLEDPEPVQAHHETQAALDQYMFHPNTAPHLAVRFAQRFGVSNPSPGYIERIAAAFRSGLFVFEDEGSTMKFGSGDYGDMAATIACVLLDREARATILDADPTHGSMKEPLLKIIGLMRSMEFQLFESSPLIDFKKYVGNDIGQMAYGFPSVFSFFLPEHKAPGIVAQAGIVAPEAQQTTGPKIVNLLNGLSSLIKYGLDTCYSGFANQPVEAGSTSCGTFVLGQSDKSVGRLEYTSSLESAEEIVDELATLLTSGRLSKASRAEVKKIFELETNKTLAMIQAQVAITTAPEFHSTNLVHRSGVKRSKPTIPPPTSNPYKAVVYVLLAGGMDSWNMLVPHECKATNSNGMTVREQYEAERTVLAYTEKERIRIIDADGQPCEKFAVHENLKIVEELYKEGDLAFFANVGVVNAPMTKANYGTVTSTNLFAHNTMQEEARKNDPFDGAQGTGVLGRMCDRLGDKGFNAKPITLADATIATVGVPGAGDDPLFLSTSGSSSYNTKPRTETFDPRPYLETLNDATELQSSLFGETWSSRLTKALADSELISEFLDNVTLTETWATDTTSKKFRTASDIILTHKDRATDRDAIYLELGGWDHHSEMKSRQAEMFVDFNQALTSFKNEMEAQGLWDNVTVVLTSDFGRTLTANSGFGSDHAWGGNYFVAGGSVKGGQVLGQYPDDLTESGPVNIGRGRIMPTSAWESVWNSVVEWMGIDGDESLDYCLPNRANTGAKLYTRGEVFDN